jgi:hypothetical protein
MTGKSSTQLVYYSMIAGMILQKNNRMRLLKKFMTLNMQRESQTGHGFVQNSVSFSREK